MLPSFNNIYNKKMDYQRIYNQIIERAKTRQLEGYKEKHHIIPKCLGGSNNKDNLVELTAREHFLCHMLLYEMYPNDIKLKHALFLMNEGITKNNYSPSSKTYHRLKEERSKLIKGNKSIIGKKIIQYDLNGQFIKIWNTIKYAALELGINDSDISVTCKGKQKTAGGYQWKYYTENFPIIIPPKSKYKKPHHFNKISPLKNKPRNPEHIKGRYKPIEQFDKQGNFIKSYNFIREACHQFGGDINKIESNIGACCRKKQKSAYGYIWRYKN